MKLLEPVEQLRVGLDYHLARHNLLTSNLAHVDTPGYRPKDLERRASFETSLTAALTATNERHFGAGVKDQGFHVITDRGAAPGLDGNSVSIDREAVKIAANNIRYETISALVADELSGLSWAANDGRNG
jgi:flagellar basal-body rod protein FlgB